MMIVLTRRRTRAAARANYSLLQNNIIVHQGRICQEGVIFQLEKIVKENFLTSSLYLHILRVKKGGVKHGPDSECEF